MLECVLQSCPVGDGDWELSDDGGWCDSPDSCGGAGGWPRNLNTGVQSVDNLGNSRLLKQMIRADKSGETMLPMGDHTCTLFI